MWKLLVSVYAILPKSTKKYFANIEAVRRNLYRRTGKYFKHFKQIDIVDLLSEKQSEKAALLLNDLLLYACKHIPFYKDNQNLLKKDRAVNLLDFPFVDKAIMSADISSFMRPGSRKLLARGKSSGSTGHSFTYYRDTTTLRYEYALYDRLYQFAAQTDRPLTHARISGVRVVDRSDVDPPHWYFIRTIRQLQLSAYHLSTKTCKAYLDALRQYNVQICTGYAQSWLILADLALRAGYESPQIKAIVTDSEGITEAQIGIIKSFFKCPVYQTYGLGETGFFAVQCAHGSYHIFQERCLVEIIDSNKNLIEDTTMGEIVVTDLLSHRAPFIRYKTGDLGRWGAGPCACGWKSPYIKELAGRTDDYILTTDGRTLSHVYHFVAFAQGVRASQIVQDSLSHLQINIIPGPNFEPDSLSASIERARIDLPEDMSISWTAVESLEKTASGKIKFIIRRI